MYIIWGRKNKSIRVASAGMAECPICRQATGRTYWLDYSYFHIQYFFGRLTQRTYRLTCDRCNNGSTIKLENVPDEVRLQEKIPFMHRRGLMAIGISMGANISLAVIGGLYGMMKDMQARAVAERPAAVVPLVGKPKLPANPPPAPAIEPLVKPAQPVKQVPSEPKRPADNANAAKQPVPERVQPQPQPKPERKPRPKPVKPEAPLAAETAVIGGARDPEIRDTAPPNGLLVGFEVGLGTFGKNDIMRAVRPIYRAGDTESLGQQVGEESSRAVTVKARPGYAVGAITVKAGLTADGFSVTFMRIEGDRLDVQDTYESDWLGGKSGSGGKRLGGDGRWVLGIIAKQNKKNQCTGLGLRFARIDGDQP